jgi:hypothetical protein
VTLDYTNPAFSIPLHHRYRPVAGNFHRNDLTSTNGRGMQTYAFRARALNGSSLFYIVLHCLHASRDRRLRCWLEISRHIKYTAPLRTNLPHALLSSFILLVPPECEKPMRRRRKQTISRLPFIVWWRANSSRFITTRSPFSATTHCRILTYERK